ncbi:MAG: DUF2254 domain-containing protein [Rhizobiaceae bacterium]|nr:DUF2254 domain-containing protein [Rhizobiaceae bacterium]
MTIWTWRLRKISRALWLRATLFSVAAVVAALFANYLSIFVPNWLPDKIGADSVQSILTIIASSMLTVTTFSLSIMVAAFGAATSNVTPRATRLLMTDKTTHNVLSTFLGAFLFSLVGIIALSAGAYDKRGRAVLFVVTIIVIITIVGTLLRWIEHLSAFGRLGDTTERVENSVTEAMRNRKKTPYLGGVVLRDTDYLSRTTKTPVFPGIYGYVQHIDIIRLGALCEECDVDIFLDCLPGSFIGPGDTLAHIAAESLDDAHMDAFRQAFTLDHARNFDQDPRFGISVLTEIASRALSPAVNDPGTAIDVLSRHVRILSEWSETETGPGEPISKRVFVPDLDIADLFDDAFRPIARDGAAIVEIQQRLQKALASLATLGDERFRQNAKRHSDEALKRARDVLIESDMKLVESAAAGV